MAHATEYGEPGHRVAETTPSITQGAFTKLCDQIREMQGTSTEKVEWVINASTTLSYELFTYNTETAATMEFVLRRDGQVVTPEVRADVQRIHRWLQLEKLHTYAESLLDATINPPPAE
jgi:hypothetical protein